MPHRVMYVALKTGFNHDGPAWIGLVHFSKTGWTLYYRGHSLQSLKGRSGWAANYVDIDSGDEFWVSGEEALTGEDVWLHAIGISGAGTRPARPGW
jgi:hypothetical protein